MKLKIENFGKIKNAEIEVSGLSLLTGNNDSGKSTVGKVLFSIIETVAIFKNHSKKKLIIEKNIEAHNFVFSTEILEYLKGVKNEKVTWDDVLEVLENFSNHKDDIKEFFNEKEDVYNSILSHVEKFDALKFKYDGKNVDFKISLQDVLDSEFKRQFNKHNSRVWVVNGKTMLSFSFDKSVEISEETDLDYFVSKFYNKVFFLESPWVLESYKLLKEGQTYLDYITKEPEVGKKIEENYDFISLHDKEIAIDINNSIKKQEVFQADKQYIRDILDTIRETIKGDFVSDNKQGKINFVRDEKSFDISNVASGIKSFGLLVTLLKADLLNNRTILVLDEPEAHLHPVWQVKYAEIIAVLVKNGVNILIASHSSLFIDALRRECMKLNIWDDGTVNLYHSIENKEDNTVDIVNVKTLDAKENIIFKSFYKAYEDIERI